MATKKKANKSPRRATEVSELRAANEELRYQIERLSHIEYRDGDKELPPDESRAIKLTRQVEESNRELNNKQAQLNHHREQVHQLELGVAAAKLNIQTTKSELQAELAAPTPLV